MTCGKYLDMPSRYSSSGVLLAMSGQPDFVFCSPISRKIKNTELFLMPSVLKDNLTSVAYLLPKKKSRQTHLHTIIKGDNVFCQVYRTM